MIIYLILSVKIVKAIIKIENQKQWFEAPSVHTSKKWNQRVSKKTTFPSLIIGGIESFPLLQNQNLTKHLYKYDPCKSPHISTEILMFRHFLFWWIHYICIICSIEGSPRWLRISTTRLTGSAFSHIIFNGANLINPIRTGHRVIHTSKAQKETKKQNTAQRVYMCFWAKMLHEVIIKSTSLHILPWFAWILGPLASLWLVIAVGMTFHTKVPELLCILTQDLSNLPGGTGGKHNDVGSKMWFHTNLKNCPSTCIICPKYEKLIVESTWMIPKKKTFQRYGAVILHQFPFFPPLGNEDIHGERPVEHFIGHVGGWKLQRGARVEVHV